MRTFLIFLLVCCSYFLQAQNFKAVDDKVRTYPKDIVSAEQLAAQIEHDFSSDIEKVRAIYTWLASNISYDLEKFYKGDTQINFSYVDEQDLQQKLNAVTTHTINETMRSKKAVCEGYAQTFKKVSELLNIPSLFITGYSKASVKDIGIKPAQEDHAWNAVRIKGKWHLLDVTWGAGTIENRQWKHRFNDFFFLTHPEIFSVSHFPTESDLAFIGKKISVATFFNAPLFSSAFFKHQLELYTPLEGQIMASPNSQISFEMGQLPANVSLHYAFRETMRPTPIEPVCKNSKCTFSVPFAGTKNTELFIIANKETAVQYKVKLKN